MKKPLSRRTLLRGAGGAALALPMLDAMLTVGGRLPRVEAAGASPRRALFFMTGNGIIIEHWVPRAADDPTSSEILKPLAFVKNKVITIQGVPQPSTYDKGNRAQGHPGGAAGALTGAYAGEGSMYGGCQGCKAGFSVGESVDAAMARHLGTVTRFPNYHLGAKVLDNTVARRFFYSAPRNPVTPIENPYTVFQQVFSMLTPGKPNEAVKKVIDHRRSVLNLVMDDYRAVQCTLGGDDRKRLEQHVDRISEIEKRLGLGAANTAGCARPTIPEGINHTSWGEVPRTVQAQLDMAAMMFACDLTRVIGFQIAAPDSGGGLYPFLGLSSDHHNISHNRGPDPKGAMRKINTWHAEQIAYVVKKLQAVAEPEGTLFDNTTILWTAEVGNGWTHDRRGMAWTIVGDGGRYFKTGRVLKYSGSERHAHNRLLVHYLNMMGSQARHFGVKPYGEEGPLEGLTA